MINQYFSERVLFAYFYRKPPIFGIQMNIGALAILRLAPFFMFAFGYWQLGNRQIFFNMTYVKENNGDTQNPYHELFDYSQGLNHTAVFIVFFPFIFFFRSFLRIIRQIAKCLNFLKEIKGITLDWKIEVSINEELGNYWNCLPGISQIKMCV